jgi:hypothetical protein
MTRVDTSARKKARSVSTENDLVQQSDPETSENEAEDNEIEAEDLFQDASLRPPFRARV